MSGLSVQANHTHFEVAGTGDDWNTLTLGGQERSLKTERDVALLMEEIAGGRVDGASIGDHSVHGHKVTVGKVTYDLETSADAARFAADLRDGKLDGRSSSSDVVIENGSALIVDGRRYGTGSVSDVRALVTQFGGADARWIGDKTVEAGGTRYDLRNKEGMEALAADLVDGTIDGTPAGGVVSTAGAVDANGYPTASPTDASYVADWRTWMETHTYEDFKAARAAGAIPDENLLFADSGFGFALRDKGEQSARFWETLSFMQRNKQQIFEHISRGWA